MRPILFRIPPEKSVVVAGAPDGSRPSLSRTTGSIWHLSSGPRIVEKFLGRLVSLCLLVLTELLVPCLVWCISRDVSLCCVFSFHCSLSQIVTVFWDLCRTDGGLRRTPNLFWRTSLAKSPKSRIVWTRRIMVRCFLCGVSAAQAVAYK